MTMPDNLAAWGAAPRLILCAGMKSSGSTWLFNVVNRILKQSGISKVMSFYADAIEEFLPGVADARFCVIKTHMPVPALQFLAAFNHAPVLLSVREPLDAVASLMARFDHNFDFAAREVIATADRLLMLYQAGKLPIFRYEDRFYDREATVHAIAAMLNMDVSEADARAIFADLTRDKVRSTLDDLQSRGVFGAEPDANRYDPATHWHPGHIGDTKIGKFTHWLSADQQTHILVATAPYRAAFGYRQAVVAPVE